MAERLKRQIEELLDAKIIEDESDGEEEDEKELVPARPSTPEESEEDEWEDA
jgi:hypothetical protein